MSDGTAGEGEDLKTNTVVKSPALNDLVLLRARFAHDIQDEIWAVEDWNEIFPDTYTPEQIEYINRGLKLSLAVFDMAVDKVAKMTEKQIKTFYERLEEHKAGKQ